MILINVPQVDGTAHINPNAITHVSINGDFMTVHMVDGKEINVDAKDQKGFMDTVRFAKND